MDNLENNINMKWFLIDESILHLGFQLITVIKARQFYSKDQNFTIFQRSIPNQTKFIAMKLRMKLPHETMGK